MTRPSDIASRNAAEKALFYSIAFSERSETLFADIFIQTSYQLPAEALASGEFANFGLTELSERIVHDLNKDPRLAFDARQFDVVIGDPNILAPQRRS